MRGELSQETDTRLRFLRRLLYAVIILIGCTLALAQFAGLNELAASLLASGAIAAAILGFAARQTLANFIAGIMLAITQPIRVGDWVFLDDHYGVVEDIRLNYTFLRTLGDQQVVDPEREAGHGDPAQRHARRRRRRARRRDLDPAHDGRRPGRRGTLRWRRANRSRWPRSRTSACGSRWAAIRARRPSAPPREAELRLRCLTRLRADGLLPE